MSRLVSALLLLVVISACGESLPPMREPPDARELGRSPEQIDLRKRLMRELEPLQADVVCVVMPARDEPVVAYVRPKPEVVSAARRAVDRLGARSRADVRTTTRFATTTERRRLLGELRASAPPGLDVNQEGPLQRDCPRIALEVVVDERTQDRALDWARDTEDRYGDQRVFVVRVPPVVDEEAGPFSVIEEGRIA